MSGEARSEHCRHGSNAAARTSDDGVLEFRRQAAEVSPDANPQWDPPRADWIDLDWAPESLRQLLQLAKVGPAAVAALERSTIGDALVDVAYLDHDDAVGIFGPPPRAVAPAAVAEIATTLAAVDWEAAIAVLPGDAQVAQLPWE